MVGVRFTKTSGTFVEMSNDVVRAKLEPVACQSENRGVSIFPCTQSVKGWRMSRAKYVAATNMAVLLQARADKLG